METESRIDRLVWKMFAFNRNDPQRIQHLVKVHRFAQLIARGEDLDPHTRFVTECAALVHDIGIRPALEKYGACHGRLQEQEGPAWARPMLEELGLDAPDIDRICYLVGHHHTYTGIDGIDYQILVEADFLVNFYEDGMEEPAIATALDTIFRTRTGKELGRLIRPAAEKTEDPA